MTDTPTLDKIRQRPPDPLCGICEEILFSLAEREAGICRWCNDLETRDIPEPDWSAYRVDLTRKPRR